MWRSGAIQLPEKIFTEKKKLSQNHYAQNLKKSDFFDLQNATDHDVTVSKN